MEATSVREGEAVVEAGLDLYGLLGEQVQPCVFRPGPALASDLADMFRDEGIRQAEIYNICPIEVGLDDRLVGYEFRVRWVPVPLFEDEWT